MSTPSSAPTPKPDCSKPSRGRYTRQKCRCEGCKEANRVYMSLHRSGQIQPRQKPAKKQDKQRKSGFDKELSGTTVGTLTREEWMRAREAPQVHVVQRGRVA